MAYDLNENVKRLSPYQPICGEYEVRLDANESFISLDSEIIRQGCEKALSGQPNRYPDPFATSLCNGFAKYYGIVSRLVTAGNGSDEIISFIVGTFFDKNDELLTLEQDFSMYRIYGESYNKNVTVLEKTVDLQLDIDAIIEYAGRNKSKGLIFSNPCNPTSQIVKRDEVLRLVKSLPSCLIIVDEAYMDFADESVLDEVERLENMIVLKTCSKAVGLASIRLGFAVACERLTTALHAVKSPYNVNSISQAIGEAVFENPKYIDECIEKILKSKGELFKKLNEFNVRTKAFEKVFESHTNFIYIKLLDGVKAKRIYELLLESSIAIRQMGQYLRISAGSDRENNRLINELYNIFEGGMLDEGY